MSNTDTVTLSKDRLFISKLECFYNKTGDLTFAILRIVAGIAMITHGYGKFMDPYAAVGMVESLGFYPGIFWSPVLSYSEFFGGILLAIGLFTRPAAVATTIILLVTVYFHWIFKEQGWSGSEKSVLWAAITLFFVSHGGGKISVDRVIGKEI